MCRERGHTSRPFVSQDISMPSAIAASPVRISHAATEASSPTKNNAASFTRQTPSQSSKPIDRTPTSKIKDQGGISPAAALYEQIRSTGQGMLASGHFAPGVTMSGDIDLGATPIFPLGTHFVHAQAVGNEVHTNIFKNGLLVHDIRWVATTDGNARIFLNGQMLTPNSPLSDLQVVGAVTFGS
jgi:hypothetical protein